jgi:ATP-dependent metalloprotease
MWLVASCVQVKELVKNAYSRARVILMQHEKDLHKLAKELLDKETLSGEQIRSLLKITSSGSQTAVGSS